MMCAAAAKTRADILKAFRKVKDGTQGEEAESVMHKFRQEGLQPVLVTEQHHDAACKFLAEQYIRREPTSSALGVTWTPDVDAMHRDSLWDGISLMVVTDSGDIVCVLVTGILKEGAKKDPIMDVASDELAKALTFYAHKDEEFNFFKRYSVTEAVHILAGSVLESHESRGIITITLKFVMLMAFQLGYRACFAEATNPYTQRLCAKFGYDQLAVLKYDDYQVNGERVFKNMPARYTSMILYGKKLQGLPLSKL